MRRKQNTSTKRLESIKTQKQKSEVLGSIDPFTVGNASGNTVFDINFLQRKYEEQKKILSLQNKRLEDKLIQEINLNEQRRFEMQKMQQRYQIQMETLRNEIKTLKNKLQLNLQQQKDPDSFMTNQAEEQEQQRQKQYLKRHKQLILKYKELQIEHSELQEALILTDQEKQELTNQNNELVEQNESMKMRIINSEAEFGRVKELLGSYDKEKDQINKQFDQNLNTIQLLEDQLNKYKEKLAEQKKKKKETQKLLENLQQKFQLYQKEQTLKYQSKINQIIKETERERQKNVQLTTKLSFSQISIQKKQTYLKEIENFLKQTKEQKESLQQKNSKLQRHINDQNDELNRLNSLIQSMKDQFQDQNNATLKKHQEQITLIKKKTIQEIYPILKDKNEQRGKKNLQTYLRNCKSSGHFLKMPIIDQMLYDNNREQNGHQKTQNPIEKFKLQSQINSLEMQKINFKKQIEHISSELSKSKSIISDLKTQNDSKSRQNQQLSLKIEKLQNSKASQFLQMRKQISSLKTKQTQALQLMRDRQEYEQAISLKISFYDKKIKELLENIQRKENIIDKLKTNKSQIEEKIKFYQDKIQKISDENDALKRSKHDIQRKDQLCKDYRNRYEKLKSEQDDYRQAIETLRKDKQKLQSALDSKEQYINTLKKKQMKDLHQLQKSTQDKLKSTESKLTKNIKETYQTKIKKLKKQSELSEKALLEIKQIIIQAVQSVLSKSLIKNRKSTGLNKNDFENYEAAKLLGLNGFEMESFLNPNKAIDQGILDELQAFWRQNDFGAFVNQGVSYLISKNNTQ